MLDHIRLAQQRPAHLRGPWKRQYGEGGIAVVSLPNVGPFNKEEMSEGPDNKIGLWIVSISGEAKATPPCAGADKHGSFSDSLAL